jgi:hypothetical protein
MSTEIAYTIPLRYRKMENLHIVFWLFKDISWCMIWKPLGIAMIFPTLIISIVIAWRTRELVSELTHNLAITFWITANAYWMISEFFSFDSLPLYAMFTFKHLALVPFLTGVSLLAYYYIWYKPHNKGIEGTM